MDHRRADVFVAEELLDGSNVVAFLAQVSREAVAEGVAAGEFVDFGCSYRLPCTTVWWSWWRRNSPVSTSTYVRVAGKTHCQGRLFPASGYFRARAHGSAA